jgi:hypothetical protein
LSVAITFLLTGIFFLLVLFSFGRDMIVSFGRISDSWAAVEARRERDIETTIAGPPGQWAGAEDEVNVTISNTGKVALGQFADWDVVFEIQQGSGLGIAYVSYVDTGPLAANQWTVDGIYRDAANLTPETVDPGILNPGEEMVVRAKPDPPVVLDTFDRVTFSTPNGITARVVLEIIVTPTPTP